MATDAERDATSHQVIDRHRVRLLVSHRQIQVDRLPTQVQPHGDLGALSHEARLPGFGHDRGDQLVGRRLDVVEECPQDDGSLWRRTIGPHAFVERPPGLHDRLLHLGERGHAGFRDRGLVGRVLDGERPLAFDPTTRNVRAPAFDHRVPFGPRSELCSTVPVDMNMTSMSRLDPIPDALTAPPASLNMIPTSYLGVGARQARLGPMSPRSRGTRSAVRLTAGAVVAAPLLKSGGAGVAFAARAGRAHRRGAPMSPGVPAPAPSWRLAGAVAVDDLFMSPMGLLTSLTPERAYEQSSSELEAAVDFYESRGWLDDPSGYFAEPDLPPRRSTSPPCSDATAGSRYTDRRATGCRTRANPGASGGSPSAPIVTPTPWSCATREAPGRGWSPCMGRGWGGSATSFASG